MPDLFVVDDSPNAEARAREKWLECRDFPLRFHTTLSGLSASDARRTLNDSYTSEVAVILDLALSCGLQNEAKQIAEELGLSGELKALGEEQMDAVPFVHDLLCNNTVRKALVLVATSRGQIPNWVIFFDAMAKQKARSAQVKFYNASAALADPEMAGQLSPVDRLDRDLRTVWNEYFGDPIDEFIETLFAGEMDFGPHPDPADRDTFAYKTLSILLDMPENDFEREIWTSWGNAVDAAWPNFRLEVLKTFGGRPNMSPIVGWFLALGAYRHCSRGDQARDDWNKVFSLDDLNDAALAHQTIIPPGMDVRQRKLVMKLFFEICKRLFDKEIAPSSPLTKVTLSTDEGLTFHLNSPCTEVTKPGRGSLVQQIAQQRNRTLGWPNSHSGVGTTSRALWDYYLATSVCSELDGNGEMSVFHEETVRHIGIFSCNGATKVTFK